MALRSPLRSWPVWQLPRWLAACITAVRQLRESGWLADRDEVVVLNTGAGLKYPDLIAVDVPVLAPNVTLTPSVPIIDVPGPEPVEHRGYVPPRSIVVPGTRPKDFPAGTYNLACALIIGERRESTDLKTSLNDALREHGIGTG